MIQIVEWQSIERGFCHTLLVGNGASIAVNACFSYDSLLTEAREHGMITPAVDSLFEKFQTTDFESVMDKLWTAGLVNTGLHGSDLETIGTGRGLRNALVKAVRLVHPQHEVVKPHLPSISGYMRRFNTVISLNYDLIVYWAMLFGNQTHRNWFKDCFVHGSFCYDWRSFYQPRPAANGATLVFYPHGSLALSRSELGGERKVHRRGHGDLLTRITEGWNEDWFPLFVSEGDTSQKVRAIRRSSYLNTVFDSVLPGLGPTMVVYGWSVSDNDSHILERICNPQMKELAFSVRLAERSRREVQNGCARIQQKIFELNPRIRVCFYSAESAGCWLNYESGDDLQMAA